MTFTHDELHAAGDALPRPYEHCYWLLPGRVLAGEHPGARGGVELMAQRLRTLQAAGVGCFIDLTTPHDPLPAYAPLSGQRLAFPIGDFGIPSVATMRAALDAIASALGAGVGVYLHCRAGVGRTGTVAGCWLVEQGLDASAALALLQRKFQASGQSRQWPHDARNRRAARLHRGLAAGRIAQPCRPSGALRDAAGASSRAARQVTARHAVAEALQSASGAVRSVPRRTAVISATMRDRDLGRRQAAQAQAHRAAQRAPIRRG